MMIRERATRRTILRRAAAASALVAAPAYLRHATAATPIKIGIPTVITGGYALLGSQVIRTCKLVKKLTRQLPHSDRRHRVVRGRRDATQAR